MTDRNSETITLGHEYTTYSWGWWTTPPRSIVVNALVPVRRSWWRRWTARRQPQKESQS